MKIIQALQCQRSLSSWGGEGGRGAKDDSTCPIKHFIPLLFDNCELLLNILELGPTV